LEVFEEARAQGVATRFIFMTAGGDERVVARARRCGAWGLFEKPFDLRELSEAVRRALRGASGSYSA
jgi:DNA-binding response OmpR family regulator